MMKLPRPNINQFGNVGGCNDDLGVERAATRHMAHGVFRISICTTLSPASRCARTR